MAQYELNLRDYFRIFNKRKGIIIFIFTAAVIGTVIYLSNQVPIYEASTTVKWMERKTQAGLMVDWLEYNPADALASEAKIIKSFPVLTQTAQRLNLIKLTSSPGEIEKAVSSLQGQVQTSRVENTNIIKISAFSESPREAMDVANSVAEVYVEYNISEKNRSAQNQRQFIEEQLDKLQIKISEGEDKIKQFREQESALGLAETIQNKLIDLEFGLAANLQKYTESHPTVIQLKEQIKQLKDQLKNFAGQDTEYMRIDRELKVNQKLYALLKERLEEARISESQKASDITILDPAVMPPPKTIPYKTGAMVGGIMGLLLGVIFAFLVETLDTSIGTIEDVENVVKLPVLSVIPSIAPLGKKRKGYLGRLLRRLFNPEDEIKEELYARLIVHHDPKSPVSEAYRNLRTNLKLGPNNKTLLFTSSGPREGKSTVIINLALTIAQKGEKVLLVSADMRRPTIAKTFGVKREPGLHEVLVGSIKWEEALRSVTDIMLGEMSYDEVIKSPFLSNLWIIPEGKLPANPAEILGLPRMSELINDLKADFDYILFDAPPVLPITDASILANKVDSIVLCYEIGRTARSALLRTKNQLESVGGKLAGIVLNHINPQTEEIESYPYAHAYKYGYYYGEEKGKSQENKEIPS